MGQAEGDEQAASGGAVVFHKPVAASFTMVVELLLLALVFFVVAVVFDLAMQHEAVLAVATFGGALMAAGVNVVVFACCALYRKSSVVRWRYFQAATQASFCTVLVGAALYALGLLMFSAGERAWVRGFFAHSPGDAPTAVQSAAAVVGLAMHCALVLVAALGSYASTMEGGVNVLFWTTPCFVTAALVWVAAFELAEGGALHCYAATDAGRALFFACCNLVFTLFFVLHVLDAMDVLPLGAARTPWWLRRPQASLAHVQAVVWGALAQVHDARSERLGELPESLLQALQAEVQASASAQVLALSHRPVLSAWRALQVLLALLIALAVPTARLAAGAHHSDAVLLALLEAGVVCVLLVAGVLLSFDFMQLLRAPPAPLAPRAAAGGGGDKRRSGGGGDAPRPGGDVLYPGGDVPRPGGDVLYPSGDVPRPGGDVPRPGGDVPYPGGDVLHPSGNAVFPRRRINVPLSYGGAVRAFGKHE